MNVHRAARIVSVVAAIAALAPCLSSQDAASRPADLWRTQLDAARAEAARTGRPMCVVFRCTP